MDQKPNKQTSHETQRNVDNSCISVFTSTEKKKRLKTSEDDGTKFYQLQLSVNKFPDAA